MTATGLTPTGFVPETAESVVALIEADERASVLGVDVDTSAESFIGALNGVMADRFADLWQGLGIVYNARAPRAATFQALNDVCALTGTNRRAASHGQVPVALSLNAGITVPAGSRVSVTGDVSNLWQTLEAAVNPAGSPAVITVAAECVAAGRFVANAGTLTVIATPVSGWTAATNTIDAVPGLPVETDPQLRTRREAELFRPGTSPVPAIYANLLDVEVLGTGVVASLSVEENTSDFYDALLRPPHSVEAVVQFTPGLVGAPLTAARQAFAEELWRSKAGGIGTDGSHTATVLDSRGQPRTIRWSEPSLILVYVSMILSIDPALYNDASSDLAAKLIVTAYGDLLRLGRDVIRARLIAALIEMTGVIDVIEMNIGTGAGATHGRNLSIGPRELAKFDTGRIVVTTEIASEP